MFLPDEPPRFSLPEDKATRLGLTAIIQQLAFIAGVAWFFYQLALYPF